MLTIDVKIEDTDLVQRLENLQEGLVDSEKLHKILAFAVETQYREHFISREQSHANKRGWKRQHFWKEASDATRAEADAESGRVIISKPGVALQRFGGTVVPSTRKYLTIPLSQKAYGRSALEFEDTFVWKSPKGFLFISRKIDVDKTKGMSRAEKKKTSARKLARMKKSKGQETLYLLLDKVNVTGDATALPSDESRQEVIRKHTGQYIERLLKK